MKIVKTIYCNNPNKNLCYIVYDIISREAVLIDPAWKEKEILAVIKEDRLTVISVLLTHSHTDHVELAAKFTNYFGVPAFIDSDESKHYCYNFKGLKFFEKDSILDLASFKIKTIATPGHTLGSVCFLIDDNLFTGDTLFIETVGVCYDYGSSVKDLYKSIKTIKRNIKNTTKVYPGHRYFHKEGKTFSELLELNIYLNIDKEESFINYRLANSKIK